MLVTLADILKKADKGNYAVVAPDYTSMTSIRYQLEVAEKYKAPIMLSYTKHMKALCPTKSWDKWIKLIREESELYNIDVCLHLDHGTTVEECKEAVDSGFTGIMMDASSLSFAENVDLTSQVVEYSHKHGVSVEAEIGHVGTAVEDSYIMKDNARAHLTQPEEAKKFVDQTKTDSLAIAIGTVHGEYKGEPHLDFELLEMIDKLVSVPLVIHGGSGTGDDNIRKAVSMGIRKINVFTDWIVPAQKKTAEIIAQNPRALGKIEDATRDIIYDVMGHWFNLTSSGNKG
jgi:ketose-bisphosphate aldolase